MERWDELFELDYKDKKLVVQRHSLSGQVIFKVQFPDGRDPLVLTRAIHANTYRFWTSIPEGRQSEAKEIGPLITEYFKKNQ